MNRMLKLSALMIGVLLALGIALFLMLTALLGEGPVMKALECRIIPAEHCLQAKIRAQRRELAAAQRRLEEIQARMQEREALFQRLAELDYASESFAIFYKGQGGGYAITTGHGYVSLLEPDQFDNAWCYAENRDSSGVFRKLTLATMDRRDGLAVSSPSASQLSGFGMTQNSFQRALQGCVWPEGVA